MTDARRSLRRARATRGFTLIELMLVVGIVGIMATVAVGMGTDVLHRQEVNGVARQMYGALSRARAEALRQNRLVTAAFSASQVRVFIDTNKSGTYDEGDTSLHLYPAPGERPIPADVTLSEGVAVFNANGFSVNAANAFTAFAATLQDKRGAGRTINVESTIAGAIRIVDVAAEGDEAEDDDEED